MKRGIRIHKSLYIMLWIGTLGCLLLSLGIGLGFFTREKIVTKEVEKEVQVVPENYLFLGDSLTDYFDLEHYFPDLPVVNSGVAGHTTQQVLADMKHRVYDYNPSKIFLLIGTNDLRDGKSAQETMDGIQTIIEEIQEHRPQAKIYVESLYPVNANISTAVGIRTNETIQNVNQALKEYTKEKRLTYIDLYSKLIDEQGLLKAEYTVDGLHLSDAGYQIVADTIRTY